MPVYCIEWALVMFQMYKIIIYFHSGNSCIQCYIALILKFILISNFLIVSAYNIDTNYPILYPNDAANAHQYQHTRFSRSYYGYSVLLHRDSHMNTTWLLIGAPRGNYTWPSRKGLLYLNEPGVVYRCNFPGKCMEIEPAIIEDEEIYLRQLDLHGRINKKHSWFGGTMSIERNSGFLTICAPRTIMNIILSDNTYVETMQGMCYSDRLFSTMLNAEMFNIELYDFSKNWWFDPMHGFSVTFASSQDERTISRIVGNPNDEISGTVTVSRFTKRFFEISRKTKTIPINDDLSQFGYSVTSGYYFNRTQSLYASSDPGWNYVGQVAIIDPAGKQFMITNLCGTDIGEFFGASLATGDLNKDGLHDLIIGAPHWGNDNGRVHIYLGSPKGEFEDAAILEGVNENAQFGYAVASGDIDGDGFSDIIVGAPWEESGALYVYNGDASLKNKVRPIVSQRISMQSPTYTQPILDIRTFGFSISEPLDIDENGYADIAVGAYKSGHVVVLRSSPVVRTNLTIHTIPSTLERNISDFLIRVCVKYYDYDAASTHAFKISLSIDTKYKRTKQASLELFSVDPPLDTCVNTSITLLDNIQDFIEPITIYASHDFTRNKSREFCKTCPVENIGNKLKGVQALLPFDTGCGEDRVCNSNISATMKFWGVGVNDSWIIGSNDITLEARLTNHAEPAYLTTTVFTFPRGIVLRSILPSCEEYMDGIILVVTCNIDNPLGTDEQKVLKLDLDMRYLTDGSLHGRILEFSTEIKTRSVNHGIRTIKFPLILQSDASLLLNGQVTEMSYYLSDLDKGQLNVSFQHTYQILKFGATPIKEAQLLVKIPTTVDNLDSLLFLYKPRVYISGKYYDCLSNGIDLIDVQQNELLEITDLNAYKINNNGLLQNTMHKLRKRHINSHTILAARVLQTLYNMKMVKSENPDGNLTTQDIAYLNCSTYNVNCSIVYCDLSALKTQQDVGKLVVRLILNATKLKDIFGLSDETKIIKFSTEAYVQIIQPANRIFNIVDARSNINLTTEFHSAAKMQKLQIWVVLASVSLGLILLFIAVIILSMVGFFKRTTKEELSALKEHEIANNINKEEITSTSS